MTTYNRGRPGATTTTRPGRAPAPFNPPPPPAPTAEEVKEEAKATPLTPRTKSG